MLKKINDIDVERLAEIYDSQSMDTFISVYLDRENFEKTMEWVEDYIGKKEYGEKGLIIFASHINNFLRDTGFQSL